MEFETLKKIIAEVLGVDPNEITLDTTFTDDLGADSLYLYQIILEVPEELNIEADEQVASGIKTVGDAVELLEKSVSDK